MSGAESGDTWIPKNQQEICEEAGAEYHICPELLESIIEHESSGKWYARNGDCIGLMQVSRKYHTERMKRLGYSDLWNEEANIYTGTDLLYELCERYGDVGTALMAYNGTPHPEQRTTLTRYAQSVLDRSEELERIHGKMNYERKTK